MSSCQLRAVGSRMAVVSFRRVGGGFRFISQFLELVDGNDEGFQVLVVGQELVGMRYVEPGQAAVEGQHEPVPERALGLGRAVGTTKVAEHLFGVAGGGGR